MLAVQPDAIEVFKERASTILTASQEWIGGPGAAVVAQLALCCNGRLTDKFLPLPCCSAALKRLLLDIELMFLRLQAMGVVGEEMELRTALVFAKQLAPR